MTETAITPRMFPALRYRDAHAAIHWLVDAFGFEKQAVFDAADGSVGHAELRFGSAVIGLNSAGAIDPANPWTRVRQGIYVQVQAVDEHHARAVGAGAEIVRPLTDMSYGSRDYTARDSEGHLWGFGTYAMGSPAGPPDLFVALHYDDGPVALTFLESAFGFATTMTVPGGNGVIVHAEARFGDAVVMLDSAPLQNGLWGEDRQCAYLAISDPDAHYARARAAGATIVRELADTSYGSREYAVRDPEGFLWSFGTYRPG